MALLPKPWKGAVLCQQRGGGAEEGTITHVWPYAKAEEGGGDLITAPSRESSGEENAEAAGGKGALTVQAKEPGPRVLCHSFGGGGSRWVQEYGGRKNDGSHWRRV